MQTKTIPVRLNPDMSTITEVLASAPIREPRPHTRQSLELEEGSAATVVIPGQNLWRNPVVLLGSQQADEVVILPDMRGLIAKFKDVRLQRPRDSSEGAPLVVWTSEGRADAALVYIKPSKPAVSTPQAMLASGALVAGQPVEIRLTPAQKSFYEIKAFVGAVSKGDAAEVSISSVQDEGASARFEGPKLAKAKSGDSVFVQVTVKSAPDNRPPLTFGGPMTGVYYATADESKAKVTPAKLTVNELGAKSFTVTLPVASARAYPGSDADTLNVKLVGQGKAPKLDASECKRGSTKPEERKCEFTVSVPAGTTVDAEAMYKVAVSSGDQPIPVTPETITIAPKAESGKPTAAKPRSGEGKAGKK